MTSKTPRALRSPSDAGSLARRAPLCLGRDPGPVDDRALLLDGSKLQYNDYWLMIDGTFRDNGLFDVGSLFTFQNEHPVVIPKLVYWLNAQVAAGSNITLGILVVVIVVLQVGLVRRFLAEEDRPRPVGVVLLVVSSILLFSRQGAHNFFLGMSGIAWLSANLFALAALVARWTDRDWLAIGLARRPRSPTAPGSPSGPR